MGGELLTALYQLPLGKGFGKVGEAEIIPRKQNAFLNCLLTDFYTSCSKTKVMEKLDMGLGHV